MTTTTPTTPAAAAGYLLLEDQAGYNGYKQITVTSATQFTYATSSSTLNSPAQGTIELSSGTRIDYAATAERISDFYSANFNKILKPWMFVVLNAKSTYKNETIASALGYTPVTDARTIRTTAPLSGGGDLSANRTLSITQATTSTDGYLSSTNWNTFNNKFTLPSLTSGSVLFSNGTTIAQDNANLFWDDTNNRLGIGTNAPDSTLSVNGNINLLNTLGSNRSTDIRTSNSINN